MRHTKTIERNNEIVSQFKIDPKGFRKWAADKGYSYNQIKTALEDRGYAVPKKKRGRSSVNTKLYNSIVETYHKDPNGFWSWVKDQGYENQVVRRAFLLAEEKYPKKGYKDVRRVTQTPKSIHIIAGLLEGKSQLEVAKQFGCSRQYAELVYTWSVNAGIKFPFISKLP